MTTVNITRSNIYDVYLINGIMNVDTGGMEDSQTITEEELTSTKQDRPKSDEIIAKVEELGQNMAPARAQEPTEGT